MDKREIDSRVFDAPSHDELGVPGAEFTKGDVVGMPSGDDNAFVRSGKDLFAESILAHEVPHALPPFDHNYANAYYDRDRRGLVTSWDHLLDEWRRDQAAAQLVEPKKDLNDENS